MAQGNQADNFSPGKDFCVRPATGGGQRHGSGGQGLLRGRCAVAGRGGEDRTARRTGRSYAGVSRTVALPWFCDVAVAHNPPRVRGHVNM